MRTPKRRILALCEGKITEPTYLDGFKRWCRNPLVDIEIPDQQGTPRTLVEAARDRKQAAEKQARREKDDNLLYDEVWCVADVDEHPKLDEAKVMASDNGIEMALSNPCFELWLLLHFRDSPGARHRHDLQRLMCEHIHAYDKHLTFDDLAGRYGDALRRAAQMQKHADEDGEPDRNPTTGVFRLTESIARKDDESSGSSGGA